MLGRNRSIRSESIHHSRYSQTIQIGGTPCEIVIADAKTTRIDEQVIVLDEQVVKQLIADIAGAIQRNTTKYNPVPTSVVIRSQMDESYGVIEHNQDEPAQKKQKETVPLPQTPEDSRAGYAQIAQDTQQNEESFLRRFTPRYTFMDVVLSDKAERQIRSALSIMQHKEKLFEDWGLGQVMKNGRSIVLNFYGPPGTGKTMTAEAIAHELGKPVYLINYAELESKYVGETPKNIQRAFQEASKQGAVLVFDEADSFLGKRLTAIQQSADYGVNITRSVMLMELERFDGIVILTTNLIQNYDDAFRRRILANVAFELPDISARLKLWGKLLPKRLPLGSDVTIEALSTQMINISGADMKDILLYAATLCIKDQREKVSFLDFEQAYEYIKNRYVIEQTYGDPFSQKPFDREVSVTTETITQEQLEKEVGAMRSREHE